MHQTARDKNGERAAGDAQALDRQRKPKHRSHHHEEIASGCCGRRGCLLQVGVGFATTGTLGRRRRGQRFLRSARASRGTCRRRGPRPQSVAQGMLMPMTPARRSGSFAPRRDRGAPSGPAGPRQRSGCSGPGAITRSPVAGGSHHRARLAGPGNVTESGRGHRWRARAATRVIQHAVPLSRGRRAGSIHEWGHAARSRGTTGEFPGSTYRVAPPPASLSAARRVVPASSPSRALGL